MSYPQNPDFLVLSNSFYPKGLHEIDIWNYYQKIKNILLKETLGKRLLVFFSVDLNKTIVLRKNKSKGLIRLTPSDYDTIVSGRTISFHTIMEKQSDFGIIDIDTDNFSEAKIATLYLYELFLREKFCTDIKIRYTGKSSFHLIIYFNNDYEISYIKKTIFNSLIKNNVQKKYTISNKRVGNIPNIDLNRNIFNNSFITLNSLSVDGLRCLEINPKFLKGFQKEKAKIKK